jgi:hypothetical protein
VPAPHYRYVTVIIDLTAVRAGTGPARLLDMVEGRSTQAFKAWLAERPDAWRDAVEVVAMDGFTLPWGTPLRAATLGPASRERSGRGRRRGTRQLTLNLSPGDNGFVVCGGVPCPTIVRAEFVQERCRSARSKEVSPIFVHSRVLTPSRWSL